MALLIGGMMLKEQSKNYKKPGKKLELDNSVGFYIFIQASFNALFRKSGKFLRLLT